VCQVRGSVLQDSARVTRIIRRCIMRRSRPEMKSFPSECPNCYATAGFPYRVGTDPKRLDSIQVDMRCRVCKGEWHFERSTSALVPPSEEATHAS
jgi:hypothetical protein